MHIMKKKNAVFAVIFMIAASFLFSSCLLVFLMWEDRLSNHKIMSAEKLTAYMNDQGFGSTFTLVDTEYKQDDDYKHRLVTLNADNLPGKTVVAGQAVLLAHDVDSTDFDRTEQSETEQSARMVIATYKEYFFTDYYAVKYQHEIHNHFAQLYDPLINGNDFLLACTYDSRAFEMENHCDSAQEFIESFSSVYTPYKNFLLVNAEYTAETEQTFNDFCEQLEWSLPTFNCGSHLTVYFTTAYSAADVTKDALINGTFYQADDKSVTKKTYPIPSE